LTINNFFLKIFFKTVDGNGLANEEFMIKLEKEDRVFYEKTHASNKQGHVMFNFNPNNECNKACAESNLNDKPQQYTLKVCSKQKHYKQSLSKVNIFLLTDDTIS
jgi:hypothetical protein